MTVDRWSEAQEWQLRFWQRQETRRGVKGVAYRLLPLPGDDSNGWWRDAFDGYRLLPRHLGDYLEVGCGPYTNTRLILRGRTARRVVCSDPLANSYLRFRRRWLARAYRAGRVEVDDHPIEGLPYPDGSFDTVVIIDVLDYVQDPTVCLERCRRLLRPGGLLVLGQDLADPGFPADEWFRRGHPHRLTVADVDPHLAGLETVYRRQTPPRNHYGKSGALAYIGQVTAPGS